MPSPLTCNKEKYECRCKSFHKIDYSFFYFSVKKNVYRLVLKTRLSVIFIPI